MKRSRHEEILSIIVNNVIETQEELAEKLKESGFTVTQATVSRDIRELNLTKISGKNGRQRYAAIQRQNVHKSLSSVIKEAIKSAESAGNLLVIKTLTGMGMAVAVNIDEMNNPEIIGTIAGDDVVFCAVKNVDNIEKIKAIFIYNKD